MLGWLVLQGEHLGAIERSNTIKFELSVAEIWPKKQWQSNKVKFDKLYQEEMDE